jgi:UDP-N-acetylmuramoylalanine--D-glutamate ligase
MGLAGQRVLVVGLARSGVAAARYCAERGARVVATDLKGEGELGAEVLELRGTVALEVGGHKESSFTNTDLVIVSPGVPWEMPELRAARAAGVTVIAELEFAFRELTGRVVAVTGTKGKSTTTAAIGAMLQEAGYDVRVGGNIGRPAITLVDDATEKSVFVLEVSSFQLEGVDRFHPEVAVFLNLSADHLDRHPSFEAYARAKARIFENQQAADFAVVNGDDPEVVRLASSGRAKTIAFTRTPSAEGAFFAGGLAQLRRAGKREVLFREDMLRLPGEHLAHDLLAAATAARLVGAAPQAIARAAAAFRGAEHVLEEVATIGGVSYYNDSKATSIAAAQKSLESFHRPILVIMGGRHKGGDFGALTEPVARRVRRIFAIGEARAEIARALGRVKPVEPCDSMEAAVQQAAQGAQSGDVVLLAPACSSFDMFTDYAHRGREFKAAVAALAARPRGREGS